MSLSSIMVILLLISSFPVFAYKMTIYTDQTSQAKAQEVQALFRDTYPFNQYNIEFEIVSATAAQLNCNPDPDISRLVVCNSSHVTTDSASRGSDQAFIVRDLNQYGGSGGSVPVITTQSSPRMILHEYLHTLGLSDEYEYAASEAPRFCNSSLRDPNLTLIAPLPSYANDPAARTRHSAEIPWYARIIMPTLITHGTNLGTGTVNTATLAAPNTTSTATTLGLRTGLYRGRTCNNMPAPAVASWHPNGEASIMDNLSAGLGGPLENIVAGIYDSRGISRRAGPPPPPPVPATVVDNSRPSGTDTPINTGNSSKVDIGPSVNR